VAVNTPLGPRPVRRDWLLAGAAIVLAAALGFLAVGTFIGADRSGDAVRAEDDQRCRAEWAAWVQTARDGVIDGAGTISQAIYRGLRSRDPEAPAYQDAVVLGGQADEQIEGWRPKLKDRQHVYRGLLRGMAEGTDEAADMCDAGPPRG
jgi:hypothetical protein